MYCDKYGVDPVNLEIKKNIFLEKNQINEFDKNRNLLSTANFAYELAEVFE